MNIAKALQVITAFLSPITPILLAWPNDDVPQVVILIMACLTAGFAAASATMSPKVDVRVE